MIDLAAYRRRRRADGKPSRSSTKKDEPKVPYIVSLMGKAQELRRLLDSGEVKNQAELAQREGVSRTRITQLMKLLRLAPDIQEAILTLPAGTPQRLITERKLRPLVEMENHNEQREAFKEMAGGLATQPRRQAG